MFPCSFGRCFQPYDSPRLTTSGFHQSFLKWQFSGDSKAQDTRLLSFLPCSVSQGPKSCCPHLDCVHIAFSSTRFCVLWMTYVAPQGAQTTFPSYRKNVTTIHNFPQLQVFHTHIPRVWCSFLPVGPLAFTVLCCWKASVSDHQGKYLIITWASVFVYYCCCCSCDKILWKKPSS